MIIILSLYRALHVMQELENLCQSSYITDPSEQQLLILSLQKYVKKAFPLFNLVYCRKRVCPLQSSQH